MMDTAILFLLAICQGITGVWAFVTSTSSKKARVFFGIVTFIGVGLVIVSGYRSGAVLDEIHSAVYAPPRLTITSEKPVFVTPNDGQRYNVYFKNEGQRPIRGVTSSLVWATSEHHLDANAEDQMLDKFKEAPPPRAASTDYIAPGEDRMVTLPDNLARSTGLTNARLKAIRDAKQTLYVAVQLSYFDADTGNVWTTEWCQYMNFDMPAALIDHELPHSCIGHNRVFER